MRDRGGDDDAVASAALASEWSLVGRAETEKNSL